jgi:DNA-directed RNA polymerase beta subunit
MRGMPESFNVLVKEIRSLVSTSTSTATNRTTERRQ